MTMRNSPQLRALLPHTPRQTERGVAVHSRALHRARPPTVTDSGLRHAGRAGSGLEMDPSYFDRQRDAESRPRSEENARSAAVLQGECTDADQDSDSADLEVLCARLD